MIRRVIQIDEEKCKYLPISIERQHNKPIANIQFDFVKHIYKVLS